MKTGRDIAKLLKIKRELINKTSDEIDSVILANIPDFSILKHRVSLFKECEKSPIGMCVWNLINCDINSTCKCRYCENQLGY